VVKRRAYRIDYSPEAVDHIEGLTARESAMLLDVVGRSLAHEPTVPTRHRKVLRANSVAPWELRIGRLRVYYDVKDAPERVVVVKAVGVKERNRVLIGGEEVEL
jgi:mRNA-degrading endonuclease RelE of RelBE toxin-antitoxin system